jgi:V-type H+-transporting ATPase subunit e
VRAHKQPQAGAAASAELATLPYTVMSTTLPTLFVLALVLGLMAATWVFTPKGPNQTCVRSPSAPGLVVAHATPGRLVRSSVLLTLTCCYLMWMVTYLAQVNPLIGEKRVFPLHMPRSSAFLQGPFGSRRLLRPRSV